MQNSIDKTGYCTYLLSISISLHLIFSIHMIQRKRDASIKSMRNLISILSLSSLFLVR